MFRIFSFIMFFAVSVNVANAQFISEVLEYNPAPGQFINSSPWGVPNSANSLVGGVTGSMSLGAFGGYVVFKFDKPVDNHPDNPYGVDFTIMGNPLIDWSEPGIVSVMKDENNNGLPDDTWYELAGSDYFFSSTIKNYEVTYTNPNQATAADVSWFDNQGNNGSVLVNSFHNQPYYPITDSFPIINSEQYILSGTRIADEVDRSISTYIKSYRKPFGYVDNQLRGVAPYTIPDNPYTSDKENSGGDAFDIDWAVDEKGNYVDLNEIDFVKVHNGVLANAGWLGEVSTEITGAVDVEPNASVTGILDIIVLKELPDTIETKHYQIEAFAFHKGRLQTNTQIVWESNISEATVDAANMLTIGKSGELILTASLADNPSITATISITANISEDITDPEQLAIWESQNSKHLPISIFPNPVTDYLSITGVSNASVYIFNITGNIVLSIENYTNGENVDLMELPEGLYIVKIRNEDVVSTAKFIKE